MLTRRILEMNVNKLCNMQFMLRLLTRNQYQLLMRSLEDRLISEIEIFLTEKKWLEIKAGKRLTSSNMQQVISLRK